MDHLFTEKTFGRKKKEKREGGKFPQFIFEATINLKTGYMWYQKEKRQANLTYEQRF